MCEMQDDSKRTTNVAEELEPLKKKQAAVIKFH